MVLVLTVGGGETFDGTTPGNFTFSIGQEVGTEATVQFQMLLLLMYYILVLHHLRYHREADGKAQVNTDWVVQGDIFAENYIVSSSVIKLFKFSSGSTRFGNNLEDKHQLYWFGRYNWFVIGKW